MVLSSFLSTAILAGCGASPRPPAHPHLHVGSTLPASSIVAVPEPRPNLPPTAIASPELPALEAPHSEEAPSGPARLERDVPSIAIPAGRSIIEVAIEPGQFISVGVLGEPAVLLGFDIVGPPAVRAVAAHGALDEDGILPRMASFRGPPGVDSITVLVDVVEPAQLVRIEADPSVIPPIILSPNKPPKKLPPLPLIGFPAPLSRDDGYLVQSPARYQFIRIDVAAALLAALRQTRVRFRRDPIAIADISQWNGQRPATDRGKPRHISHEGGRDIDIALPANDDSPSIVRPHCDGVLIEADVQGCAPGTTRGFDALRAAYFLGLLLDGLPPGYIERVFTDDAYIREIRRAAETLRSRRWIKDAGFEGLFDDSLIRPSPWHVDHMHIRFSGDPGRSPW